MKGVPADARAVFAMSYVQCINNILLLPQNSVGFNRHWHNVPVFQKHLSI